ncbi:MAG: YgjP-like metallopeptidase domain-containing protein [Betaproteobacteria bacterium]
MKYLQAYPPQLQEQALDLIDGGGLAAHLQRKYPDEHLVRTDRALYDYVLGLKNQYLRGAEPLSKVLFDNKLQVVAHALGTHTAVSRVQGGKLKAKREIRIAALFRHQRAAFLRMITVHELAHLKEKAHDKAFYQLCSYMEPDYHQIEFDLRMLLTHLDRIGPLTAP